MDIVAYFRVLRRHWRVIAAATLIGAVLGAASTLFDSGSGDETRDHFKATHTLFLDTNRDDFVIQPTYDNLDQLALLVTSGEVPDRVADELSGDPAELVTRILTVTNSAVSTLDIVAIDRTREGAAELADTFAEQLLASVDEREQARFVRSRDDAIKQLQNLQNQVAQLDAQLAGRPPGADLLAAQRDSLVNSYRLAYERFQRLADQVAAIPAISTLEAAEVLPITESEYEYLLLRGQLGENRVVVAESPSVDDPIQGLETDSASFQSAPARGFLGGFLGLFAGIGLAMVFDRVDRRLRSREAVEEAFGMPVLAEIPTLSHQDQRTRSIVSLSAPLSRTAEAHRTVRSSLLFQRGPATPGEGTVVLVSSPGPKEGKTTTSANLAVLFAESGARVLAVNCDFRRPTLHQHFGLADTPRQLFETGVANLWLVTNVVGTEGLNPATAIEDQRKLVKSAKRRFDIVILDTAPMLATNDAVELIDLSDLVVVVARAGVTTSDAALRTRELLSRIDAPAAGVVLLNAEATESDYYHYYSRARGPETRSVAAEPAPRVDRNGRADHREGGDGEEPEELDWAIGPASPRGR